MNQILDNLFAGKGKKAVEEVKSGKAYLIDVRRDGEWAEGHAKPAIHIPVEEIQTGRLPELPKEAKIYTYCQAGGRAKTAMNILKRSGFKNALSLGGLVDWENGGGEVV